MWAVLDRLLHIGSQAECTVIILPDGKVDTLLISECICVRIITENYGN